MSTTEDQAHRAAIRQFDTHAPVAAQGIVADPLKMQLIAHYDALTTDYARRLAVQQISGLAGLCKNCVKE